jgi:16S rRNA (cytidine1402-2'-O)-methyltransferase
VVATPIGNLGDITLRAIEALREADLIACEDTRVTGKLLKAHGIDTRMIAYHDHNAERVRPVLIEHLQRGEKVALVSDAGTPLVSDPGYRLVREAVARGIPIIPLPGPSAALTALVVAGLPTDRFFFIGFLPQKAAARRAALAEVAGIKATLLVYESPHRLAAALADMAEMLGARDAAVARELTKLFEEARRGTLAELAAHYAGAPAPKGEIVVVVGPPSAPPPRAENLDDALRAALKTMSVRDAVAHVASETGIARSQVYARALELAQR